jgi:5-formyltetrahydrofolate cyclo-ligase
MAPRRTAVDPREAEAAATAVTALLLEDPAVQRAGRIALYAALPDDLPTKPLFHALASTGSERLMPRIQPGRRLVFCAVERWSDLVAGRHGIPEPPEGSEEVAPTAGDLVLVPGLAFDAGGWRLGRGGGYYDRAFPPDAVAPPLLFGLGYALQMVPRVPHDSRDRRMDAIVTERGIRRVTGTAA